MSATFDEEAISEARVAWNDYAKRLRDCLVPPLYRSSDVGRLDPRFLAACRDWSPGATGLGLVGGTGCTKTRCAYWLIERLVSEVSFEFFISRCSEQNRALGPYDTYTHRLSERVGPSWFPQIKTINEAVLGKLFVDAAMDHDDSRRHLERLHEVPILFIDDIGQGRFSERVCAEIYELLEVRTSHHRPIIFTSNFGGSALAARFPDPARGAACVRRLAEFCKIVRLE